LLENPPAPQITRRPAKRGADRARTLLREQLKQGPKPEALVIRAAAAEAAEIPERALIAAASLLGVRTRKGNGGWRRACAYR
jgi:hypothetical protein